MTAIQAVIFDMDGLMFDTETIYYQSNQKTADEIGLPFDYPFYEEYIGASDEDFFQAIYDRHDDTAVVDKFVKQSREDIVKALKSVTLPKKKGLLSLLEYLKAEELKLVVASSTERWLVDDLLEKEGLAEYFDAVVGGDEVEKSKPHPAIFLKAWENVGVAKEHTLVLEDSLNGIRSAYAAGIPVIMVPDLFHPNEEATRKALAIYADLHEVKEHIKERKSK